MDAVVVCSVRDDLLPRAVRCLPPGLPPLQLARRDFPVEIPSLYQRPEEAGTDRLLCCVAARARSAGAGAVVVDFGTAVTLSVVSPDGVFLGGLIGAGHRAVARGIELCTPRLAEAARGRQPGPDRNLPRHDALPRATLPALQLGILTQVGGGVRAMLQQILRSLSFRPRVLATGGEAELFRPHVPEIEDVLPDLLFEGLALCWRDACAGRPAGPEAGP
jgi:type III pantothenate kinase